MRTSRPTLSTSRLTPAIRILSSGKGLTTTSSRSSPSPPRGLSPEVLAQAQGGLFSTEYACSLVYVFLRLIDVDEVEEFWWVRE